MSTLEIHMFPCLADNYGFLIHDAEAGVTAAIDTPDVDAILKALMEKAWRLTSPKFDLHQLQQGAMKP